MAVYIADSDLTDRLPSLTNSDISTAAIRLSDCITPASAWVDSVYPMDSPFVADPNAPGLIKAACLEYALFFAHSILAKGALAEAAERRAKSLLNIDEKTGLARAFISGVHTARKRIRVFDLARSRDAEERDSTDAEKALYP